MAWTLRFLVSEATHIAKCGPDDIQVSMASFYVNNAQRDVANRIQQLEFERIAVSSTSSGDDKVFLPTDCERVLNLSFGTGGPYRLIPQVNVWDIDRKSMGSQTAMPQVYASYASWLELYPSPNSQYSLTLRYVARLSDITSLDAIPSVDTRYHQAILFKTVSLLAMRKPDLPLAAQMDTLYERELRMQPSVTAQRQLNKAGAHCVVQLHEGPVRSTDWERSDC